MVPVVFCNGRIFKVPKHETEYLDEIAVTANNGIDKLYKKRKKYGIQIYINLDSVLYLVPVHILFTIK